MHAVPEPAVLMSTRGAVHRLAEHVLAAARYAHTKRIGLLPLRDGLGTPSFGGLQTVVAVRRDQLVVVEGGVERHLRVTSLREAGDLAGVVPGAPAQVYAPVTPCDLDAPLDLDPDTVAWLGDWWTTGAEALQRLSTAIVEDQPSAIQLWPEHLDVALSAGSVNYGVSPGDAEIGLPYVYVGPHGGAPDGNPFWNASFGAARTAKELGSADELLAFFVEGHRIARQATELRRSTS